MPSRPSLPNSRARSRTGARPSSYQLATCGRTALSSNCRTTARISRSSSECSASRSSRSMSLMRSSSRSGQQQDARVDRGALLQCGAQRAVQAVLQVEAAVPLYDVREEVTVERGVLGEQPVQGEFALGRGELVEPYRPR